MIRGCPRFFRVINCVICIQDDDDVNMMSPLVKYMTRIIACDKSSRTEPVPRESESVILELFLKWIVNRNLDFLENETLNGSSSFCDSCPTFYVFEERKMFYKSSRTKIEKDKKLIRLKKQAKVEEVFSN